MLLLKRYKGWLILLNLLLVLVGINFSIWKKEQLLKNGRLLLLELAPVDPRSLIQGDYMRLRYAVTETMGFTNTPEQKQFCILNDSARFVRFQAKKQPLKAGEYALRYKKYGSIGAESYFFQEGQAQKYEKAKYGGIKVDDNGNSVLVGLYNEKRQLIK